MGGFTIILLVMGLGITGNIKGAFIDNRNVISLSRFQMIAWSVLVLSSFFAAVLWNCFVANALQPVNIELQPELWMLMGISTASLVGSPLILNEKKNKQPDNAEFNRTLELLDQQGYNTSTQVGNQGLLVVNELPKEARWSDLFTGEETGNFAHLDLARLQMFFFTIVAVLAYGVTLGHQLGTFAALSPEAIHAGKGVFLEFPELSQGLLALIGISHTGYLASKRMENSQTASSNNTVSPSQVPVTTGDDQPAVG